MASDKTNHRSSVVLKDGTSEMDQAEKTVPAAAPLVKEEMNPSQDVLQATPNESLGSQKVDIELAAFAESMMVPVYNAALKKTEKFAFNLLRDLLKLRNTPAQQDKYRMETDLGITRMLSLLEQKASISEDFISKASADLILDRVGEAKWRYSDGNRKLAKKLVERFQLQNWGRHPSQPIRPDSAVSAGKRKRPVRYKSAHGLNITAPIPSNDDPIFGPNGPMYGTLIKYNNNDPNRLKKSVILNQSAAQKNSRIYGHNGFDIGRFFLRLMAALAQGAHGARQAGIHGTDADGVFSIVVSGTYNELERDSLESFEYCTAGSIENTSNTIMVEKLGLRALRKSQSTQNPVRVLRGANSKFPHAPDFGYRYDGLYVVRSEAQRFNGKGGMFAAFRFDRVANQRQIDLTRPHRLDREENEMLKKRLE